MVKKVLILCWLFTGCVEVRNSNDDKPSGGEAAIAQTAQGSSISWTIASKGPHQHSVFIRLDQPGRWIRKVGGSLVQAGYNWEDRNVTEGASYQYDIGVLKDQDFEILRTFTVKIPKDIVYDTPFVLDRNDPSEMLIKASRLFLIEQGEIRTHGRNLKIEVDEFHCDNRRISTFVDGQRATIGVDGKDGGKILVIARKAFGNCRFEMRGEGGGIGMAGQSYSTRATIEPNFLGVPHCYATGSAGKAGGAGGKGGFSGNLILKIEDTTGSRFESFHFAGVGGPGGVGGAGQFGSEAYPKRECLYPYNCAICIEGPTGPTGAEGQAGDPGGVGSTEIQ